MVANSGKYWHITCSLIVSFFLFIYCLNNKSYSEFGEQWKAAMSKRTEFNALKISLHLCQNNRSMPGLLSYSWDNVSAWKACNICNGETSEKHKKNCWFRSRFRTILIKFLRLSPKYIYCLFIQLHACPFLIWTTVIIQSCVVWTAFICMNQLTDTKALFRLKFSFGFKA